MNENRFSPVVLFVFARPDHTKKTVDALLANPEAGNTDLIVYADAARSEKDVAAVEAVREIFSDLRGFKSVKLVLREKNVGLAKNIIEGVTQVIKEYGKVIVMEDDIVTSPYFLKFMNDSLDLYENSSEVISISGCNYPVDLRNLTEDTYFLRIPLCWGWATWHDRWSLFSKDLNEIPLVDKDLVRYINFEGAHDYFQQAKMNYRGKLNTWFIFWYISSAKNRKLTLFPSYSLVSNIGFDGSGENCGESGYLYQEAKVKAVNVIKHEVVESKIALNSHIMFFNKIKVSIFSRAIKKAKRLFTKWAF